MTKRAVAGLTAGAAVAAGGGGAAHTLRQAPRERIAVQPSAFDTSPPFGNRSETT